MKNLKLNSLLTALVMMSIGVLLVVHPGGALATILRLLGVGFLLIGLFGVVSSLRRKEHQDYFGLIIPIAEIVIAVVILVNPGFAASVFPVIVGLTILLDGIKNLLTGISEKKENNSAWKFTLILSMGTIILGCLILFNPFSTAEVLTALVGFAFIYEGITNLLIGWKRVEQSY